MNPERALQEQIQRYQRMTGEQRLGIALELHELSCNVAREGIRYLNPNADEAEVERRSPAATGPTMDRARYRGLPAAIEPRRDQLLPYGLDGE